MQVHERIKVNVTINGNVVNSKDMEKENVKGKLPSSKRVLDRYIKVFKEASENNKFYIISVTEKGIRVKSFD